MLLHSSPKDHCFFWLGERLPGDGTLGPGQKISLVKTWPHLYHMPDIECLSEHFIKEIRAIQPEGPYHLGGICARGLIAYEVARKLLESGQEVQLLAIVEPFRFGWPSVYGRIFRRVLLSIHHPTSLFGFPKRLARLAHGFWNSGKNPPVPPTAEVVHVVNGRALVDVYRRVVTQAFEGFELKPYGGRLTFVLCDQSPAQYLLHSGWSEFARGGLDVHVLRSDNVMSLAESKEFTRKISACIDEASGRTKAAHCAEAACDMVQDAMPRSRF
jgi:hypothetical protein